jgi:response regulator RpfG family c-di-GMP phosphodiesterase
MNGSVGGRKREHQAVGSVTEPSKHAAASGAISRMPLGATMTPTSKHCLLVVDDEPDVCDSVHDLLRREFRVLKATSGQEGFRIMQEEEVHIIMTDQRMPRVTGVELLARVKAKNPLAIRLLFTGYADLESIIAAINHGHVYHFLKKPWQPEELLLAVRQAAEEYDRLISAADESTRLRDKLDHLHDRVVALETEVKRLGGKLPPAES